GLYEELHQIFDRDTVVSPVHEFLARCVVAGRRHGHGLVLPLVVTTNYDTALERAYDAVEEPYDVVAYLARGPAPGRFARLNSDGDWEVLERKTRALRPEERTVILKIHGSINRIDRANDSFVIAEDQYVDFLSTGVWGEIPLTLVRWMKTCHWLFL